MAAVIGLCGAAGSASVYAQATAGNVFGKAPAGDTITAQSTTSGVQRQVQADAKGRYSISQLPVGVYTVTLEEDGRPVVKHVNVPVVVGRGIKVDFDCAQGQCAELASKP
ncbi:carboxypeptidase regulatory-like domain-containing protein [Rhodanobacter denitrificans]|nr:carboxypeptidase regulatory-like domain-containing protein [Rhodanobacter denitrificans]